MSRILLLTLTSYVLGSIPFGYLLVRIFRGEDVRLSGSGNIGATNVSRKSPILGALTLVCDAAKGAVAVQIAAALFHFEDNAPQYYEMMALAALLAVVGHMFPIWLRLRGGKGVATALGAFLRFSPMSVLIGVIIFALVVAASRRISLGSIVTAAAFPVVVWFIVPRDSWSLAFISASTLLIIVRHHQNIRRLLSGQEPPFSSGRK